MMAREFGSRRQEIWVYGFALLAIGALVGTSECYGSDAGTVVVPNVTIYPGDMIKDDCLVERDLEPDAMASRSVFAASRADLAGKVARRTLLPGAPIPLNAITVPKTVTIGAKVRILFFDGGLRITAYGLALQSGGVGDVVSVRNLDSGVTVSGIVQADGGIRVGGG